MRNKLKQEAEKIKKNSFQRNCLAIKKLNVNKKYF